jgi:hypothetical protein
MIPKGKVIAELSDVQLICGKNKLHRESLCDYILTPTFTEMKHLIASRLMQENLDGNHYLQITVTATIGNSETDFICEDRIF